MSKTPFEIRADLLKQAQDFLVAQYIANTEFYAKTVAELTKQGNDIADALIPKYPSIQDVLNEAKKFYSFVTTKE